MAEEQILKKEDKLIHDNGFWHKNKGTLVLTKSEIHFLSIGRGDVLLRVSLTNIVSVNTEKLDFADHLVIVYKDGNTERRAKFVHKDRRQLIFAAASPSYFISWEQTINDARFNRHTGHTGSIDDLERLAALKDKGVLTDEEFAAKKKELLGL